MGWGYDAEAVAAAAVAVGEPEVEVGDNDENGREGEVGNEGRLWERQRSLRSRVDARELQLAQASLECPSAMQVPVRGVQVYSDSA